MPPTNAENISEVSLNDDQAKKKTESDSTENSAVIDRVLRVLDEGIEKLKFALLMPVLLETCPNNILQENLSAEDYRRVLDLYNVREKTRNATTSTDLPEVLDFRIVKIIDIVYENKRMHQLIPNLLTYLSHSDRQLVSAMEDLRQISEHRLKTSAAAEMRKEKVVHRVFHENEKTKTAIKLLKKQLHEKEINLRWKLTAKHALVHKFEEDLKAKKWENSIKIKKEILKSTEKMQDICSQSKARQAKLVEEAERMQLQYEQTLRTNLLTDKKSREIKNRYLLQLQSLIRKYDNDMVSKISENEQLQVELNNERKKLNDFLVEYEQVEQEYNELMHRKIMEEKLAQEERIMMFMMNRAARIIQRHYRKFVKVKKKKVKGKGKKGRGKKK